MCNVKRKSDCRLTMSPTAPLSVFPCTPTCLYVIKLGGVSKPLFPPRKIFELPLFGESEDFWVELKSMTVIKHSPALPCPARHNLPYPILSYPILSHPILSHPIISNPIQSYPVLSYPILSYPILSYPTGRRNAVWVWFFSSAMPSHVHHHTTIHIFFPRPYFHPPLNCRIRILVLYSSIYFLRHVTFNGTALYCSALLCSPLSYLAGRGRTKESNGRSVVGFRSSSTQYKADRSVEAFLLHCLPRCVF